MLQIEKISKQYQTGTFIQTALDEVSLILRDNEFVAILGPSGSGKTTLLNIIGGLDRYDKGDLIINRISTKQYKDRDWDSYRNHTVGFVFQSYNLIPHQSILSNVELALTISGISKAQRKQRAKAALEEVGLREHFNKKPNQLSGGQMQRVAIARALVNDPDILLADEPTGALDTTTSIQVMELLKEVAKDRLVVMVTHNPELAAAYATRTVKLRDGKIIEDSNPYVVDSSMYVKGEHKNLGKASMSFLTVLSLSFNNLRTKKGRTILTAFAGSIGIVGIALILALSTGVDNYIEDIQKDTMIAYPITINAESMDLTGMMDGGLKEDAGHQVTNRTGVYANHSVLESDTAFSAAITENDLTAFKKYLDAPSSDIQQYLGGNGVVYSYDVKFDVFAQDRKGQVIHTNADPNPDSTPFFDGEMMGGMRAVMGDAPTTPSGAENFEELMPNADGTAVSQVVTDSYDVLYGSWPKNYNEVVLVLDESNSIPTSVLYQLGFITADEYKIIQNQIKNGETVDIPSWDYHELSGHTFNLIPFSDYYIERDENLFINVKDDKTYEKQLLEGSLTLKIVGVIRPTEGAENAMISSAVAYTTALTDYVINHTNKSAVVLAQEATPQVNVLNGMKFEASDDTEKIAEATTYISRQSISDKASLYSVIMYNQMNTDDVAIFGKQGEKNKIDAMGNHAVDSEIAMSNALDRWLLETPDDAILLSIYESYIAGSTYDDNLMSFGKVSYHAPRAIRIYVDSFEDKDAVATCIMQYNETVGEESKITYIDYVALLTSSLTSIVNIISYVLIAFVSVSLVVSCIMIGIITHISVLERTKEIGILRAIGASKWNISQMFNAETFIIGLCAGLLGVGVSALLTIPINAIIGAFLNDNTMKATLEPGYAVILIVISMVITVIAGLIPARKAAKKDPVIALRTE